MAVSFNIEGKNTVNKVRKYGNMFPKKGAKTQKKNFNETEISNLPDKKFKVMVIKMLTKLGKRMNQHSENFKRELENIIKYQKKTKI